MIRSPAPGFELLSTLLQERAFLDGAPLEEPDLLGAALDYAGAGGDLKALAAELLRESGDSAAMGQLVQLVRMVS